MNSTILAILNNLNNTISNFEEKNRRFLKIKRTSDKSIVKKLEATLFDY